MADWAHQLLTLAALAFAAGWLARRWFFPRSAPACRACCPANPAGVPPRAAGRATRLKILD